MKVEQTAIKDCFVITPQVFEDDRGYFFESFNQQKFNDLTGLKVDFVQDNQSKSSYGVIRGMHAQQGEMAQAKLVRAISGEVLDVAIDIRKNSPTFGEKVSLVLNQANKKQLFIPRGCLHGFSVLSSEAIFFYKCDNYYSKKDEIGANPLDKNLGIDWGISKGNQILSEKDLNAPSLKELLDTIPLIV